MRDIVTTRAEAEGLTHPPLLVLEALEEYLADSLLSPSGSLSLSKRATPDALLSPSGSLSLSKRATTPLTAARIGEGQSNATFLLARGEERFVFRRGPRPPLPPSAHDMLREARVQQALGRAGVPVPRILAVCEDDGVLGTPFYIMEHLDGDVVTDRMPVRLDEPAGRRALATASVDALADLHALDVRDGELATLGRPDGYLARQVDRFASLWPTVSRRSLSGVDRLAEWLRDNLPLSHRASVVHGDYRIGNLMFRRAGQADVQAILDWEMATLGDPLADLGYFIATYADPDAAPTPLELTPVTRGEGFPRRAELVARYVDRTGADVSALAWYQALALWKAAVFCEAIYTRWLDGERPGDDFGPALEAGVPALLRAAADAAAS
ncbi:phosphotransferase family protein [Microbacterium sp. NPDC055903]